jgi:hypothetical protein
VLKILIQPSSEPVSLSEAKAHLRVIGTAEDDYIDGLIKTARRLAETRTARAMLPTKFRWSLNGFPGLPSSDPAGRQYIERVEGRHDGALALPRAPVSTVHEVTYLDPSHVRQTLDVSRYAWTDGDAARIAPAVGRSWPTARVTPDSVRIDFTAGYPTAADVPPEAKHAILIILGHLFEHRGDSSEEMPRVATDLLSAVEWGAHP